MAWTCAAADVTSGRLELREDGSAEGHAQESSIVWQSEASMPYCLTRGMWSAEGKLSFHLEHAGELHLSLRLDLRAFLIRHLYCASSSSCFSSIHSIHASNCSQAPSVACMQTIGQCSSIRLSSASI